MRRDELQAAGIQVPVLPTVVLGALPDGPDWPAEQMRLGLDVIVSGSSPDSDATLAAASAAAPYRPVKAVGAEARLDGRPWLVEGGHAPVGGVAIDPIHVVVAVDPSHCGEDPNMIAAQLLEIVREEPSRWWIAARDLDACTPDEAISALGSLVDGVRMVRLFLAKQQFDM